MDDDNWFPVLSSADNESDTGYDPNFLTSLRSGSRRGGGGGGGGFSAPEDGGRDEEILGANSEGEPGKKMFQFSYSMNPITQ